MRERLLNFLFRAEDTIRLDTFRLAMGIVILFYTAFRWQNAAEWLTTAGYHVSSQNLPYHDFWVPLLPPSFLPWFGLVFFISILTFILGIRLDITVWIALAGFLYCTVADQLAAFSPNKIIIVSLFILALAPLGSHWKVKAVPLKPRSVWPVRILQATFIIHLFMAGVSKVVHGEWLNDYYVLWSQAQGTYRTDFAAYLLNHLPRWGWAVMQQGSLIFELLSPLLFMKKRFRWIGLIWGAVFQLMIALTMKHLIYFNSVIFCFFILFVEDKYLYRFKSFLRGMVSWK